MKTILITGIEGFLGYYLYDALKNLNYEIKGSYFPDNYKLDIEVDSMYMNLTDEGNVNKVLEFYKPDIIIHTAGLSNVDVAEKTPEVSYDINVKGTYYISKWCQNNGSLLIFCSTNAIFYGNSAPYDESSLPLPINEYGRHKYIAERIVATIDNYLIFRLILLYGWKYNARHNPVTMVIEGLRNNKKMYMVKGSSYINPLYVRNACEGIVSAIEKGKNKEIYHLGGKDVVDRYELSLKTAEVFNLNKELLIPVGEDYYKSLACRPYNTSYCTIKAQNELDFDAISLYDGLEKMKKEGYEKGII